MGVPASGRAGPGALFMMQPAYARTTRRRLTAAPGRRAGLAQQQFRPQAGAPHLVAAGGQQGADFDPGRAATVYEQHSEGAHFRSRLHRAVCVTTNAFRRVCRMAATQGDFSQISGEVSQSAYSLLAAPVR